MELRHGQLAGMVTRDAYAVRIMDATADAEAF